MDENAVRLPARKRFAKSEAKIAERRTKSGDNPFLPILSKGTKTTINKGTAVG